MKYDRCPRCNAEWGEVKIGNDLMGQETSNMRFCRNRCGTSMTVCNDGEYGYSITLDDYWVGWWYSAVYLRYPITSYILCAIKHDGSTCKLSYPLPFDVTLEQIKLSLVFS
jgi:hypothetical protein